MISYKTCNFSTNVGFVVNTQSILQAVKKLNAFMQKLPSNLYKNLDYKTQGAMLGALFCSYLADSITGAIVNPIEKGYPDIIPSAGKTAPEAILRDYPEGLEIKGTIGNIKDGIKLNGGDQRITNLSGITWQAHHQNVNKVLCIIWDFCNDVDGFKYPAITGVFYTNKLVPNDWGKISGLTGRNTKVCGMLKSGKEKVGKGWILLYDNPIYLAKYSKILKFTI